MPPRPEDNLVPLLADSGARVAAMLDRWAAEDVSDEPEWDIAEISPMKIGGAAAASPSDDDGA